MKKYSNLGVSLSAIIFLISSFTFFNAQGVPVLCPVTILPAGTVISSPVTYSGQVQVSGSLIITSTGSLTITDAGSGCNGDLIIGTSGTIDNSGSIALSGDLVNSSSLLKPYSGTGSLTMNSTLHTQTISAGSSGGIKVSKFHITGLDKTLKGELVVNDTLDLQAIIHTGSSDTLGIDSAGVAVNYSPTAFVQGPLYRRGRPGLGSIDSNPMIFPVGDTSGYRPVILSNLPLNTYPVIRVEAVPALSATASFNGKVSELFHTTYWQVNSLFGGSFNANITLGFASSKDAGGMPGSSLLVANLRSTGGPDGSYTSLGNGSSTANSITSASTLSASGSPTNYFALASGCLPVTGTLVANPGDSICPGETVNFSVTSPSASYDSLYYYVNGILKAQLDSGKVFASSSFSSGDTVYAVMKTGSCTDMTNKITMHVSPQTANAGLDQTSCGSASVTLNGKITYSSKPQWSITTGSGTITNPLVSNTSYTPSAADIVAGSVTLTLKAVEVGCQPASDVMQITFNTPPAITSQPRDTTVCQGATVKFKVAATGSGLTYQWQENGVAVANGGSYSGQGTSVLTLSPVLSTMNTKQYKVIVSGACTPSVTSSTATLTVNSCVVCDTSWTIAGAPFCIASLKSKLNPTVSGGVFTGTGVSEIPAGSGTYYFDPSVSGAGTFNITYTRSSCGKSLTKAIVVNDAPCTASITPSSTGGIPLISNPEGITTDCDGSIYFSDTDHNAIWKIDPLGNASVILGDTNSPGGETNSFPYKLHTPEGLVIYNGNVYFADATNHKIKRYNIASNTLTIIAGPAFGTITPGNVPSVAFPAPVAGSSARFNNPSSVAIDATGHYLYVADRINSLIKKIDLTSLTFDVSLLTPATTTNNPSSVVVYGSKLYYSVPSDNKIEEIDVTTGITTSPSFYFNAGENPAGLSVDCKGLVYFSNLKPAVGSQDVRVRISSSTSSQLVPGLSNPTALSVYNKGYIDIANSAANQILRYAITNWKTGAFNGLDTTHCINDSPPDNLNPLTCSAGSKYTGNGIQGTGPYTFNPSAAGVGRHKITYTFSAGFCTDSLITYVNVYPLPTPNLGIDTSVCTNSFGAFTLNAGVYQTYSWTKSATSPVPSTPVLATTQTYTPFLPPSSPYYYAVTVTDINGCVGRDERMVTTLNPTPVSIVGTDSVCYGGTSTLTATAGFSSYSWNTGATTNPITTGSSGDYTVSATNASGCVSTKTFRVTVRTLPNVCISVPAVYNYGIWNVSTIAGSIANASGNTDNVKGINARFVQPWDIYFNGGNLYVSEFKRIRKIRVSDTLVSTFAGSLTGTLTDSVPRLQAALTPRGIVADRFGNFYIANDHYIAKLDIVKDSIYNLAGTAGLTGTANGTGSVAGFNTPSDIDIDYFGNVYIADYSNHQIRKMTPAGVVTTYSGAGGAAGHLDGNAATAKYNWPFGVAFDVSGNLFVVEEGGQEVRKINASQISSTLAGLYATSGYVSTTPWVPVAGATARFSNPWNAVVDKSGRIFMTDALNSSIRMIDKNGNVTTIAGSVSGGAGVSGGADGRGDLASFNGPTGITMDPATGNLYVADRNNNKIRQLTQNKTITICQGTTVQADATCSGGVSYSWTKGGVPVSGATGAICPLSAPGTYVVTVTDKHCSNTDSIIVALKPAPIANAGPAVTRCGSAQIGTPGIVGNTYSWNTNPPTGIFSTSAQTVVSTVGTTNYVVTVTGANLCTNSDTVSVTITPGPIVNLGNDTSVCQFESFQKGPAMVPNTTYQWGSLPAGPGPDSTYSPITISADFVGTVKHFLTVTDTIQGCTVSDTLVVTVNPLPPAGYSVTPNNLVCRGTTINITATVGDYTKYHYDWLDPNTLSPPGFLPSDTVFNPHYKIQATHSYQLTVTDRKTGCNNYAYPGASMINSPLAGFISSSYCFPDSTLFTDTSYAGGLITNWEWEFGDPSSGSNDTIQQVNQASVHHKYSAAGIYNAKLIVTNDNNCTDTAKVSIQINDVTAGFTVASVACTGDSVKFVNLSSPVTASYRWDFGEPVTAIDSGALNPVIVYTAPNTYNIKLKASVAGCSDSTTGSVTVKSKPVVKIIPTAISSCNGSNDTLSISSLYDSPADSVVWQNLSTAAVLANDTSKIMVTATGDYKVTVTDRASQCGASDSVNISFINPPAGPVIFAPPGGCLNSGIKLIGTVTGGDSLKYAWTTSGGGVFSDRTNDTTLYTPGPLDASPLTFTFSAYNRCDSLTAAPQSVTLTAAPTGFFTFTPAEPFENDQLTFVNYTDTSAGKVSSWIWNFGDGTASTLFNPAHVYTKAGKYYLTLTISNNFGCSGDVKDSVNVSGPRIFIPNVFAPSATNPENMVCKVYGVGISPLDFSFKIFDKWGTVVYQSTDFVTANTVGWNGNNLNGGEPLPMGVYTYAVKGHFYDGDTFQKAGTVTLIR